MGHQLYRMIRDGAPATWTPLMRLVAMEIADDARDPDGTPQGNWPWSAIPVQGHWTSRGRWRDGLTERTGMGARAISRALTDLARAGYEMRSVIRTGRDGRPVYAARGHAMRFVVPLLPPRPEPQRTPEVASYAVAGNGQSSPNSAANDGQRPPNLASKAAEFGAKVAGFGDPISSESPSIPLMR